MNDAFYLELLFHYIDYESLVMKTTTSIANVINKIKYSTIGMFVDSHVNY